MQYLSKDIRRNLDISATTAFGVKPLVELNKNTTIQDKKKRGFFLWCRRKKKGDREEEDPYITI